MHANKAIHALLGLGLAIALMGGATALAKKPGGTQGSCASVNIPVNFEFTVPDGFAAALDSDIPGAAYDAVIHICSGSTDVTLNTTGKRDRRVWIDLKDGPTGDHIGGTSNHYGVFLNLRRLLHKDGDSTYALADIPEGYSFTTWMTMRIVSDRTYHLRFVNVNADNTKTGLEIPSDPEFYNQPDPTALVRVTHSTLFDGRHQWTVEPTPQGPDALATLSYTEREKGKKTTINAGQYGVPFKIIITTLD